jgi:hypothetical protein
VVDQGTVVVLLEVVEGVVLRVIALKKESVHPHVNKHIQQTKELSLQHSEKKTRMKMKMRMRITEYGWRLFLEIALNILKNCFVQLRIGHAFRKTKHAETHRIDSHLYSSKKCKRWKEQEERRGKREERIGPEDERMTKECSRI